MDTLPADHPARRTAALGLWVALGVAGAFTAFAWITTQLAVVRAGSPWQDDPYDGVVSFTEFLVPALATTAAIRASLWHRDRPQPVSRIDQLLRAALLGTVLVAATVVTDGVAVAVGADSGLWTWATVWLIAALVALGAASVVALLVLHRAFVTLPGKTEPRSTCDWLDDLVALTSSRATRITADVVRTHTLATALALSLTVSTAQTAAEAVGEGWTSPLLVVTCIAIGTGGYLAFCLLANRALHIARPVTPPPGPLRRAGRSAMVAAAIALPATAVLRDQVRAAVGLDPVHTPAQLALIVVVGALSAAAVTTAWMLVIGIRRAPPPSNSDGGRHEPGRTEL